MAIANALLDTDTEAAPTLTRPPTNVPNIEKKRRVALAIELVYSPDSVT
jgi:hypothetical protein